MAERFPRIPGLLLIRRLGGGPTSDVYEAIEQGGSRTWAVKVLNSEGHRDDANVDLFRREARVGLSLRHPHLVRFVRAEIYLHLPFHIVMERLNGRPLRSLITHVSRFPQGTAVRFVRQIAEALAAMHAEGYVHGDIKPENVQVIDDDHVKLIDLGFARRPGDDSVLIGDGYVLGTANYIAPELCDVPALDSHAADIFSLGVTLFELLSGVLPYPGGDVEETMIQHRDTAPDTSALRNRGILPAIVSLLDDMLLRNPDKRPTARAIASELAVWESSRSRRVA